MRLRLISLLFVIINMSLKTSLHNLKLKEKKTFLCKMVYRYLCNSAILTHVGLKEIPLICLYFWTFLNKHLLVLFQYKSLEKSKVVHPGVKRAPESPHRGCRSNCTCRLDNDFTLFPRISCCHSRRPRTYCHHFLEFLLRHTEPDQA